MKGGKMMKNDTVFINRNNEPKAPDELLKITALLYFKEALFLSMV